jgi:flagellar biosynthesis protein FlhG
LAPHFNTLIIDTGSGVTKWTRRLWREAQLVLVVTTPDDVAVMDAYATIKEATCGDALAHVRVLVNQCSDSALAEDAERRLATACRRFLGLQIARGPRLPQDVASMHAAGQSPRAWESPASPFGRSVRQLGRFAADLLSQHHRLELSTC